MKLVFLPYSALCEMAEFKINGIDADHADFGEKFDRNAEGADDYCCGDMQFTRIPSTVAVLKKYKITRQEYDEIAERLESELSFGCCVFLS